MNHHHACSCSVCILYLLRTAAQFALSMVTVTAENVSRSTPGARVTWNTTVPPQCVTSVRVEFRTSSAGTAVATNTPTNTSQTEIIQTGLQCTTYYYITANVTGVTSDDITPTASSRPVRVLIGGKGIVCMRFNWYSSLMVIMLLP